jgi:AraC-like DNA-binding protein
MVILYNNYSKNKNSIFLFGSLIFICSTSILHYFTVISPNLFWTAVFVGHCVPFAFLIGPFLYFYTRNTLRISIRFSKLDYLHFLPFIICLISILPYYFTSFDSKLKISQLLIDNPTNLIKVNLSWLYPSNINILLRPIFLLSYSSYGLILSYRFYRKKKKLQLIKKEENIVIKWLIGINSVVFIMCIGYSNLAIHYFNISNITTRNQINSSMLSSISCVMFCLIPTLILVFPEILYGFHKFKINTKSKNVIYKDNHESLVSTAALILDFVKDEKNLLNPDFSIADICKALNLKNQDVIYCFNTILNIKFTTLRKELRVNLAKNELTNGKLKSHSMEGVWMKCGFPAKTNFFVAFKEVTGMTPLEYCKSMDKPIED